MQSVSLQILTFNTPFWWKSPVASWEEVRTYLYTHRSATKIIIPVKSLQLALSFGSRHKANKKLQYILEEKNCIGNYFGAEDVYERL